MFYEEKIEPKDLIDAGLTRNQAKVYIKLINQPEQTGGQIAKATSLDRSFVYAILASLSQKGLVSHITHEKARLFFPSDPKNFLQDSKERDDRINKLVKELKQIQAKTKSERTVRVYNGKAGLKIYMRDLLDKNSFSSLGGGGLYNIFDALKIEFPSYMREFKKKKMSGRIITSPENVKNVKKAYSHVDVKTKTMKGLNQSVCFTLFDGKLAIYSLEEVPYVIIVQDKNITHTLMDYFNMLWSTLK
jgi:sugar-specific transcriptional regulator TrmB